MKLMIEKKINNGKYIVHSSVTELTPQEHSNLVKFGAPEIDLSGKFAWYQGGLVYSIPVHALNHEFSFDSQEEANKFENEIRGNIKAAAKILKELNDTFTAVQEYEI